MSIFSTTPVYEGVTYEEYDIAPTAEAGMSIAYEAARDISELISGLYIADAIAENMLFEGTIESVDSLLEASVGDFAKKVKEKLIKLRDKIVSWFKSVKTRILVQFMEVSKFAKKYEKDILNKAARVNYSYEGYNYKKSPSEYGSTWIDSLIDKAASVRVQIGNASGNEDKISDILDSLDEEYSTSKIKEKINENVRGDKETIKVNRTEAGKMINFIKGYDKDAKAFQKNTDNIVKSLNETIKNLDKLGNKMYDEGRDIEGAKLSKEVSAIQRLVTTAQSINAYTLDIMKDMYKVYGANLKKIFNKKVVKESFEGDDDSGNSLLEQAMQMI